jgi:hypothetical protein
MRKFETDQLVPGGLKFSSGLKHLSLMLPFLKSNDIDRFGSTLIRVGTEEPELAQSALDTTAVLATYRSYLALPTTLRDGDIEVRHVDMHGLVADSAAFPPDAE